MGNIVVILIIMVILAISISKIVSDKRKGVKCIGCPYSKSCPSKNPSVGGIQLKGPSGDGTI